MARLITFCIFCLLSFSSWGQTIEKQTTGQLVAQISQHLAKVYVSFPGKTGLGSGVVVGKNRVATNCHVVGNALSVKLLIDNKSYSVTGVTPDWQHDVCVLTVDDLNAPATQIAPIASSENLRYEQAVYTIGFAGGSPRANANYGYVKGLYPLDDSVVVRTSSSFRLGDSGGGVFDEAGQLVALIAVKSPGRSPNYYNMSVKWVKALLDKPAMPINTKSEKAFWAKSYDEWPYFMKVVHPYKTKAWAQLDAIAAEWLASEPNNLDAIYYSAIAEFETSHIALAEQHLNQVIQHNKFHGDAYYYLGLIAHHKGNLDRTNEMLALLDDIDEVTATKLREKIRVAALHHQ